MFSQVSVYSHGVGISGPMSFPGVSLAPSPFKGVVGISGTRSLLGTGYPGVGWVSGGGVSTHPPGVDMWVCPGGG